MTGVRGLFATLAAVALLVATAPAEAARPKKDGLYFGRTSQGSVIGLDVGRGGETFDLAADARTACAVLGRTRFFAFESEIRVGPGGRFAKGSVWADELDVSLAPLVIDGERVGIFDVTVNRITGRFETRRRVTGTWRFESAIYKRASFPHDDRPVDKCDTGEMTWTARLR